MKYTTRYLFDPDTGEYKCEVPCPTGDGIVPPDNTTDAPPRPPAGSSAFWNGGGWTYAEDHRGARAYAKDKSVAIVIENVGAVPDEYTLDAPLPERQGYAVQWGAGSWEYVEDHRGTVGYVAGEKVTVEELGPLPEGWSTDAPPPPEPPPYVPPPDTRTAKEKRSAAYRQKIDPIIRQITGYREEANAWDERDDIEKSEKANEKADLLLEELLIQKEAIRAEFPDETTNEKDG